jgi:hypothetical protein
MKSSSKAVAGGLNLALLCLALLFLDSAVVFAESGDLAHSSSANARLTEDSSRRQSCNAPCVRGAWGECKCPDGAAPGGSAPTPPPPTTPTTPAPTPAPTPMPSQNSDGTTTVTRPTPAPTTGGSTPSPQKDSEEASTAGTTPVPTKVITQTETVVVVQDGKTALANEVAKGLGLEVILPIAIGGGGIFLTILGYVWKCAKRGASSSGASMDCINGAKNAVNGGKDAASKASNARRDSNVTVNVEIQPEIKIDPTDWKRAKSQKSQKSQPANNSSRGLPAGQEAAWQRW